MVVVLINTVIPSGPDRVRGDISHGQKFGECRGFSLSRINGAMVVEVFLIVLCLMGSERKFNRRGRSTRRWNSSKLYEGYAGE